MYLRAGVNVMTLFEMLVIFKYSWCDELIKVPPITIWSPTFQSMLLATLILLSPGLAVYTKRVQTVCGGFPYKLNKPVTTIILLPCSEISTSSGWLFTFPLILIISYLLYDTVVLPALKVPITHIILT